VGKKDARGGSVKTMEARLAEALRGLARMVCRLWPNNCPPTDEANRAYALLAEYDRDGGWTRPKDPEKGWQAGEVEMGAWLVTQTNNSASYRRSISAWWSGREWQQENGATLPYIVTAYQPLPAPWTPRETR
jgi:hypothetical protein